MSGAWNDAYKHAREAEKLHEEIVAFEARTGLLSVPEFARRRECQDRFPREIALAQTWAQIASASDA